MDKPLILVGHIGRTLPAELRDTANKKAAEAISRPAAKASEEAGLSSTRDNDIAVDESIAARFPIDCKALRTLAAQYALAGFQLSAETGIDGAHRLFAVCHGTGQHLDSIDAARAHLDAQIGGPS